MWPPQTRRRQGLALPPQLILWQSPPVHQVKRTQNKCNFGVVSKLKVHLFVTLSYNKQNNEKAPLGNMQKLGLKGNISYTVFVNVMIFCICVRFLLFCLINKCSFLKFSFLCTKGSSGLFSLSRDLQTITRFHADSELEGGRKRMLLQALRNNNKVIFLRESTFSNKKILKISTQSMR